MRGPLALGLGLCFEVGAVLAAGCSVDKVEIGPLRKWLTYGVGLFVRALDRMAPLGITSNIHY